LVWLGVWQGRNWHQTPEEGGKRMANPYIEMMRQNRFRQQTGHQDIQNLGALGSIVKQGYDVQVESPDPRQNIADMLGQSAKEVTSNRPVRGWRALIVGMLEGAATGLKGQVSQEKKEKAEKLGRVFEWLEANGMAMAERNQDQAMKRQAEEDLEPLLKNYAQNMGTMAPLAKEKYVEYILGRLNETTGSDYELSSIDQVNPLKITVKSPQNGNALFVQDFSKRVGGVDADLYQKAVAFEDRKLDQENQRIQIAQQNTEARWSPETQFEVGLGKEGAKKLVESVKKAEQENTTLEDALYATKEAKDLLSTGKVIAGSDLGAYLQRLTGKAFNTEGMTATQLYDTAAAQLYEFAKGSISFGNTNQKEFEFLRDRIPDSSKTPKALAMMLDRFEKKIERKISRNEALISKMPDYTLSGETAPDGHKPHQQLPGQQMPGLQGQQQGLPQQRLPQQGLPQPATSGNVFKVRTPSGQIVLVPESDLDEAAAHGGTVVSS
jgi:hypothetical protein